MKYEVIVIDDGSTDGTAGLVKRLGRGRPVRYLRLPGRSGAAAARNAGVKISRGQYVAFLDSDDVWLPEKTKIQLAAMNRHRASISFTDFFTLSHDQRVIPRSEVNALFVCPWMSLPRFPLMSSCLFKRDVFKKVGLMDPSFTQIYDDVDFIYRCLRSLGRRAFWVLDQVLVGYRVNFSRLRLMRRLARQSKLTRKDRAVASQQGIDRWMLDAAFFFKKYPRDTSRLLPVS